MSSYSSNQHCVAKLVELSEHHAILASEDIYDDQGFKLLAKGARISRDLQNRLLARKLRAPLESSLTLQDGITLRDFFQEAESLIEQIPVLARIAGTPLAKSNLHDGMKLHMPPPLVLLMSCVRHTNPDSFRRAQLVAALCAGLSARLDVQPNDTMAILMAAVLHDIGEIYINPAYLCEDRHLQPAEWKHVAAHPHVGRMLVQTLTSLPQTVLSCIDQHHERHDGSGYPSQIFGQEQHPLSPIIAAADAVSALVDRGDDSGERISLALRIVPEEFDKRIVNTVVSAVHGLTDKGKPFTGTANSNSINAKLLSDRLSLANKSLQDIATQNNDHLFFQDVCKKALALLGELEKSLRATGILDAGRLGNDIADQNLHYEMHAIIREVAWRMRHLARNIYLAVDALGKENLLDLITEVINQLDINIAESEDAVSNSPA